MLCLHGMFVWSGLEKSDHAIKFDWADASWLIGVLNLMRTSRFGGPANDLHLHWRCGVPKL